MSTNDADSYLAQRMSWLDPNEGNLRTYGNRFHQCAYCHQEIIQPPESAEDNWVMTLQADASIALAAAMSGCPFFEWVIDEVLRFGNGAEYNRLKIEFKCSAHNSADMYSAEIFVKLESSPYLSRLGHFEVLADFGMCSLVLNLAIS
jgi:hypothetical protein